MKLKMSVSMVASQSLHSSVLYQYNQSNCETFGHWFVAVCQATFTLHSKVNPGHVNLRTQIGHFKIQVTYFGGTKESKQIGYRPKI